MVCRDRQAHREPLAFVVPPLPAMARDQRLVVKEMDAGMIPNDAPKLLVDPPDRCNLPALGLHVQHSLAWPRRQLQGGDHQMCLTPRAERLDQRAEVVRDTRHSGFHLRRPQIGVASPKIRRDVTRLYRENRDIGRRLVKKAPSIQDLLGVGVERADPHIEVDAAGKSGRPQERHHGFHRKGAQKHETAARQRQLRPHLLESRDDKCRVRGCLLLTPEACQVRGCLVHGSRVDPRVDRLA